VDKETFPIQTVNVLVAIRQRITELADSQKLLDHGEHIKNKYADLFRPIPHLSELPNDIYCQIKLKDANKQIQTHSYQTPR